MDERGNEGDRKGLPLKRVEDLIKVLEGSSINELELTEAGTEIIIRRSVTIRANELGRDTGPYGQQADKSAIGAINRPLRRRETEEQSVAIIAPLTGVFYASPSPTSPPFVSVGDIVQVGQVVALVEAMKVFNEIQAEASGRVIEIVAKNGNVVQKGDVLLRLEGR